MRVFVDGGEVLPALVALQERKFGSAAQGRPVTALVLEMPQEEFVELLHQFYEDYSRDDIEYGKDADMLDLKLRGLQWPGLGVLWTEYPCELSEFLRVNAYGVLGELFKGRTSGTRRYYIFSVEEVRVERRFVQLKCRAVIV